MGQKKSPERKDSMSLRTLRELLESRNLNACVLCLQMCFLMLRTLHLQVPIRIFRWRHFGNPVAPSLFDSLGPSRSDGGCRISWSSGRQRSLCHLRAPDQPIGTTSYLRSYSDYEFLIISAQLEVPHVKTLQFGWTRCKCVRPVTAESGRLDHQFAWLDPRSQGCNIATHGNIISIIFVSAWHLFKEMQKSWNSFGSSRRCRFSPLKFQKSHRFWRKRRKTSLCWAHLNRIPAAPKIYVFLCFPVFNLF